MARQPVHVRAVSPANLPVIFPTSCTLFPRNNLMYLFRLYHEAAARMHIALNRPDQGTATTGPINDTSSAMCDEHGMVIYGVHTSTV